MKYYNWYGQCPYMGQYGCLNCPAARGSYSSLGTFPDGYFEADAEAADQQVDASRTQADVERVIGIVQQTLANEINQMVALGMNINVVNYFIREMVDYLDKNYNKYTSPLLMTDITAAAEDIKTRYYWIFNIMRLFGVPFEQQMRFLYGTVRAAFQNLRPATAGQPQMSK